MIFSSEVQLPAPSLASKGYKTYQGSFRPIARPENNLQWALIMFLPKLLELFSHYVLRHLAPKWNV